MELAQSLKNLAEEVLRYEGDKNLPQKLGATEFYLAKADDDSVSAFDVHKDNGVEYKIGTKK